MSTEIKRCWKTTEFWLVVVGNFLTIATALCGFIDVKTMLAVMAILNGLYITLRTLQKLNHDGIGRI